jgi:hypothetical protein
LASVGPPKSQKINIETNSVLIRSQRLALLQPEVHNLQSAIRNPQSAIRNPQSAIRNQILAVNANQAGPPLA